MRRTLHLGILIIVVAAQLPAAELANLRNGFSIRHEHHETLGETTRLYLESGPASSYVEVSTSAIESYEPAPPEPSAPPDPSGCKVGDRVAVFADEAVKTEITGEVVSLSVEQVAIRRTDPKVGEVVVHFPRAGYVVAPR